MSIDIAHEELLPLAKAADRLPRRRNGKKTHVSTLHRWAGTGVRGIKLEALQVGGVKCTSLPALQRFFERLSSHDSSNVIARPVPNAAVEAALDAEGLGRPPPVKNPCGLNEQIGGSAMAQTENR
jgi:hypothetical protein